MIVNIKTRQYKQRFPRYKKRTLNPWIDKVETFSADKLLRLYSLFSRDLIVADLIVISRCLLKHNVILNLIQKEEMKVLHQPGNEKFETRYICLNVKEYNELVINPNE